MSNDIKTTSIVIRLKRTTIEYAYVNVEIRPDLVTDGHLDGNTKEPSKYYDCD